MANEGMYDGIYVYHYMGLYLDETEFKKLELQRANALEIIFKLQNYDTIYEYENEFTAIPKQEFMEAIVNTEGKYQDFCYRIINGCFVLYPIEVSYGIYSSYDKKLLAYYSDKSVRDAKLTLVRRDGISAIAEDMEKGEKQTTSFNVQLQLRKIYNSLSTKVD